MLGREPSLVDARRPLRLAAAFSGGADSLALVAVLREFHRLGAVQLTAIHVDHGVRPESGAEAATVAEVGRRLGVDLLTVAIDPDALARHQGVGLEEAMRRERYRVLATIAGDLGAQVIVTGHHRRDQAETVLLHLLRGAGLRGVAGIREVSEIGVPWWPDAGTSTRMLLWRPLLGEDPEALRAVGESLGVPIVEDPSNRSEVYRRNAVRHRVLPLLEELFPGAETNLAAFAQRAAGDDDALDAIAIAALGDAGRRLERTRLIGQSSAVQRRMVRHWVEGEVPDAELTFDRTEAIRELTGRNQGGKTVEIGSGWRVSLRRGVLVLIPPANAEGERSGHAP
ncbi:MAG: tRNA lysidine(34) synthetase TilS [Thermomicrobiales bacterium]